MASTEQQQPSMSEPSEERKSELDAVYQRNIQKDTDAPYKGAQIKTIGELIWIMKQRNWSGEWPLPGGMQRAD